MILGLCELRQYIHTIEKIIISKGSIDTFELMIILCFGECFPSPYKIKILSNKIFYYLLHSKQHNNTNEILS